MKTPALILVVGCGSIGLRHIRNLRALGAARILATDPASTARDQAAAEGAEPVATFADGLAQSPTVVIVCTPPHLHVPMARQAIAAGADVFVEKPVDVAATPELDALVREATAAGRLVGVGYNLRFHAGLVAVRSALQRGAIGTPLLIDVEFGFYLPDWRPGRDYRTNYGARRSEGGGILLDASHEIDYLRWIGGEVSSVQATLARVGTLDIDVEDTAVLTLRMASGAVAQVRLDFLQRRYARRCKISGSEGVLEWSWQEGARLWSPGAAAPEQLSGVPEPNEMYLSAMADFLAALDARRSPSTSVSDARLTMRVIDAARRASEDRREVVL